MSVLVEFEEANTKKVTLGRNRNVFGSLFRALAKNILTHKAEYLDSEISVSKDWKGHQTQGTPSRAHCLGGLLLYGVLKSLLMQGRPLSVSLRSETPRGIGIMFPRQPCARCKIIFSSKAAAIQQKCK